MLAEKAFPWEPEIGTDPRDDVTVAPTTPQVVTEDTFIARPDPGDDTYRLVAKRDRVPAGLEGNKRSPARRKNAPGVALP